MKYFSFFIFIIYSSLSVGQTNSLIANPDSSFSKFSLTLTTFNHAEMLFNGTTTYKLTKTSIQIKSTSFGDKKGKAIFNKSLPDSLKILSAIRNVGLDSVKNFYFNYCVMATSGNEYILSFKNVKVNKEIHLHHYYLKQLDEIVNIINSQLPSKYKMKYLTKETKQDCKL
jgi:hypothetical protein